ncbi:PRC-barrel domain-containing protein [Candidatus Bathyarchaeota archaeon]|nr:PRC-barrel domain-containing protein [Candidatus Bathyarchaeota archaeon]
MIASEFIKMQVYASGMQVMGKIRDLVVDPERYALTGFVVEVERDVAKRLGVKFMVRKAKFRVPASAVEKIGDAVVLKLSLSELAGNIQKV